MRLGDLERTAIYEATYVKTKNGPIKKITEKWGIEGRHLAKPSEGGFGCVTEDGERISMWDAWSYYKEKPLQNR